MILNESFLIIYSASELISRFCISCGLSILSVFLFENVGV